jgi:hypothetical protein
MKDLVLYETVPTKFVSSFLELYFIFYEFSNFRNVSANMTAGTLASLPSQHGHGAGWLLHGAPHSSELPWLDWAKE